MHEILQTLSLAVTSIPSVTCVVAANCPKPMAALEVFPHFQVDFSSLKAKTLIAQLRFVPTSFGFWLLQMSCNSSTCLHMVHPPLPPRNHLQLDLEFPEKNAGGTFQANENLKNHGWFHETPKKQENMIAEQYHNSCHNFCKLNRFFTSLVTTNALNILDWLHDPLQQCDSVLIVGSFPVGCQIATNKMMQNSVQTTMV